MTVPFATSPRSTVGIEWELMLADADTGDLVPRAPEILDALEESTALERFTVTGELLTNTVEITSRIGDTVAAAVDDVADAIAAVRALAPALRPLLLVSEIRTIAGDDLWLSPSHDVDCVALHFTWRHDVPAVSAFLPRLDDALAPFAARPHWGKLFETTPDRLLAAYPRLGDFRALADRLDPAGKLRNDLTDWWLGRG